MFTHSNTVAHECGVSLRQQLEKKVGSMPPPMVDTRPYAYACSEAATTQQQQPQQQINQRFEACSKHLTSS